MRDHSDDRPKRKRNRAVTSWLQARRAYWIERSQIPPELGLTFPILDLDAHIVVAELVPTVVEWANGVISHLFGDSMRDPRVAIHAGDVADFIRSARSTYDAILLDVDNGPDGLTSRTNDGLYSAIGLRAAHAALRPGGVFAVWSAQTDAAFGRRLRKAGFATDEIGLRVNGSHGGARHVVWIAAKRDDRSA